MFLFLDPHDAVEASAGSSTFLVSKPMFEAYVQTQKNVSKGNYVKVLSFHSSSWFVLKNFICLSFGSMFLNRRVVTHFWVEETYSWVQFYKTLSIYLAT